VVLWNDASIYLQRFPGYAYNFTSNITQWLTMTLMRPLNKGQGRSLDHFGTNRFLIYDFL